MSVEQATPRDVHAYFVDHGATQVSIEKHDGAAYDIEVSYTVPDNSTVAFTTYGLENLGYEFYCLGSSSYRDTATINLELREINT